MTELEKAAAGLLYDANYDPDVLEKRRAAKRILHELNGLHPDEADRRDALLRGLLGKAGARMTSTAIFTLTTGSISSLAKTSMQTSIW